ncbi:hypothetical protein M0638_08015 [Roseomonas sp. NAR14]|uniref:Uncharacterized protein n=1 Tax=Roseomonas acroporae TaxID=2937791 RepID=A0A9X1YD22_9PROT|nr:hypothetical protein [Roseomonas acroporae]MCK8784321.1 hypothetical protein [Roseomonas acroporae]
MPSPAAPSDPTATPDRLTSPSSPSLPPSLPILAAWPPPAPAATAPRYRLLDDLLRSEPEMRAAAELQPPAPVRMPSPWAGHGAPFPPPRRPRPVPAPAPHAASQSSDPSWARALRDPSARPDLTPTPLASLLRRIADGEAQPTTPLDALRDTLRTTR